MLTMFLAYAPADRALAASLRDFLEHGADVHVIFEEGEMGPGENAVTKARDGLVADAILILLSPEAEPARRREEFAPAFWDDPKANGVAFGTALARDCWRPPLLERENFFDLRLDRIAAFRAIKRWIRSLRPPASRPFFAPERAQVGPDAQIWLDRIMSVVADAPGELSIFGPSESAIRALAARFAEMAEADFDGVLWTRCGARSEARIAGDLGFQLGSGSAAETREENWARIRSLLDERRCLLVLDDVAGRPPDAVLAPKRSSVITLGPAPVFDARIELGAPADHEPRRRDPIRQARAMLQTSLAWSLESADWEQDLPLLLDAFDAVIAADSSEAWRRACDLGRRAIQLTRARARIVETREIVDRLVVEARQRGDASAEGEFAWEYVWLPGDASVTPLARPDAADAAQLSLFG